MQADDGQYCKNTVGLISPDQDLLRATEFIVIQNHHTCVTQQVNRGYLTKFKMQKSLDSARAAYALV